jgi:hypothetical protein
MKTQFYLSKRVKIERDKIVDKEEWNICINGII